MLRGARCVVAAAAPAAPWAAAQAAGALLRAMASEGQPAGGAARHACGALAAAGYEVAASCEAGLVVWGLPHAAAADAGGEGGRKGGKPAAGAKK